MRSMFTFLAAFVFVLTAVASALPQVTPVWQHDFTSPQAASNPAVSGGTVYVPTNTSLHALNASTGALQWSFQYPIGDVGGYVSTSDKYVYLGTHNGIYALTPADGKVRWVWPNPYSATVHSMRPTIGQDGVYVTSGYAPLMKLRHEDGVISWFAPNSLGNAQLRAAEGGSGELVYVVTAVGTNSYAVCLNAATGAYQWNVSWSVYSIILADTAGVLLGLGGSDTEAYLTGTNASTGELLYFRQYPNMPALDYYVYEDMMYVNVGPTQAPYPVILYQYTTKHLKMNWEIPQLNIFFFTPTAAGLVTFGTESVVGYSAMGEAVWGYDGVAVNAGAATPEGAMVMVTATSVLQLPSF